MIAVRGSVLSAVHHSSICHLPTGPYLTRVAGKVQGRGPPHPLSDLTSCLFLSAFCTIFFTHTRLPAALRLTDVCFLCLDCSSLWYSGDSLFRTPSFPRGSWLGVLPFLGDHWTHPRAQPPQTRRSSGKYSRAAGAAAPSLLTTSFSCSFTSGRAASGAGLSSALQLGAGRTR